jgi:hypothetical protein
VCGIADADQPLAAPLWQAINLHCEQSYFFPIIELVDAVAQKISHANKFVLKS